MLIAIAVLLFLPITLKISGSIDGLTLKSSAVLWKIPFLKAEIYNEVNNPFAIKMRLLGKEIAVTKAFLRHRKYVERKVMGYERGRYNILSLLMELTDYIRVLKVRCQIGIKDRADMTAILAGYVGGIIYPTVYGSNAKVKEAEVIAKYGEDVFSVDVLCIISINLVQTICELLKFFCKKEIKLWKTLLKA